MTDDLRMPTVPVDNDAMTIVIHLPQPLEKVAAVLEVLAEEWPDASFKQADGLTRLDIGPMPEKGGS